VAAVALVLTVVAGSPDRLSTSLEPLGPGKYLSDRGKYSRAMLSLDKSERTVLRLRRGDLVPHKDGERS
jgi:hypothetical protein